MDDEQILARGGDEHDIRAYAEQTTNFSEEEAEGTVIVAGTAVIK